MKEELNIAILQYDLVWESPSKNFRKIESLLLNTEINPDLIILPEMFTTGFSMNAPALAEPANGPSFQWMQNLARKYDCTLAGSIITQKENKYYNSMLVVDGNGLVHQYDKRHLFHPGGEHKVYTAGVKRETFNCNGFRIFPQICYDLRFPVWTRNDLDYDLIFFIASWPETRIDHWMSLIKARAIENQAYALGVNRLGEDGNGLKYNGRSMLVACDGKVLLDAEAREGVYSLTIDKSHLDFRQKLNFLSDRDSFKIEPI